MTVLRWSTSVLEPEIKTLPSAQAERSDGNTVLTYSLQASAMAERHKRLMSESVVTVGKLKKVL